MTIKAGIGVRELLVPNGCMLFGHPGFRRAAAGAQDPLLVSALHLRTGVHGALFISLDLYGLEGYQCGRILDAVSAATSVHRHRIFLGCAHTHSGPPTVWSYAWKDDDLVPGPHSAFLESATQTIVAAAAEACATTRPVELALTGAPVPFAGLAAETAALAFREPDGTYAALLLVCPVPPALTAPESDLASADLAGFLRKRILARLNRNMAVIHYSAPSAGWDPPAAPVGDDAFAHARATGEQMADDLLGKLENAPWTSCDDSAEIVFRHAAGALPFREMLAPSAAIEKAVAESDPGPMPSAPEERTVWREHVRRRAHAQALLTLARHKDSGVFDQIAMVYGAAEACAARIGDLTLVGLPGNPAPGTVAELAQTLPGKVCVAAHVGGFTQGDIVSAEQESSGIFGAMPSPFSCQGIRALCAALADAT